MINDTLNNKEKALTAKKNEQKKEKYRTIKRDTRWWNADWRGKTRWNNWTMADRWRFFSRKMKAKKKKKKREENTE